ncbi:hypothetical protein LPJ60_004532 [Coemansia sp. RSA 2675]|uniref:Uncharacterized protein n=1 Tax=Coemansia linderi TaxID=2663919 RepID=A0ACC1KQJ0_9FUNG|nr:hypothetical protein LPJ60_004532 [Coemansia sp. RSA 2675]KAJ2792823.1 hypothetical protein GGI18_000067 [Coemansia linderi]
MAVHTRRSTTQAKPAQKEPEDFIKFADSSDEDEIPSEPATAPTHKRKADDEDNEEPQQGVYQKCYNGQPVPPWLIGLKRLGQGKTPDISEMINEEVTKFVDYISPTPEEHQMRAWVIERMQRVLDNMKMIAITPVAKCFGSFETRLYLPTSDIDMTIMLYREGTTKVAASYQTKEALRRYLFTLARELKRAGFCTKCEVIANARVPIIKTHEMVTGIAIDISINADSGVQSAGVQRSFSERVYPHSLRAIVLAIKQFLAQRSMNEVFTGGMGSYAITLLAVSMLQMHPRILSGGLDIHKNLGVLLIEFFELYGKRFNYDNVCISVLEKGQYLDKRRKGFHNLTQPYLLSIEDPCDKTNDVTKGTYGITRIRQTFSGAYDLISNSIFAYHQTRKFGEPMNEALKWLAARPSNDASSAPSKKRLKAANGKAKYKQDGAPSSAFNSDPWAPVSFLSSILSVDRKVIDSRAKLVKTFYEGTLQKILGVEYQPQLTKLLPAVVKASGVPAQASVSIDFVKKRKTGKPSEAADVVLISDDDEVIEVEDDI